MVPTAAAITLAAHAIGNAVLLHVIFSPFLEYESIVMAHLDPSDIIKTAFPLNHLCHFVALSCICPILITWACRRANIMARNGIHEQSHKYLSLINILLLIGLATMFTQCSFILCGIHPTQLPIHTFVSALYVATNTILPLTLPTPAWGGEVVVSSLQDVNPTMKNLIAQLKAVAEYLFGPISSNNTRKQSTHQQQVQRLHQCSTLGTMIGMCACAILRVFDHGLQIQRYPTPILIGATAGRVCGALLAVLVTKVS